MSLHCVCTCMAMCIILHWLQFYRYVHVICYFVWSTLIKVIFFKTNTWRWNQWLYMYMCMWYFLILCKWMCLYESIVHLCMYSLPFKETKPIVTWFCANFISCTTGTSFLLSLTYSSLSLSLTQFSFTHFNLDSCLHENDTVKTCFSLSIYS